jgi:hypothetical protein
MCLSRFSIAKTRPNFKENLSDFFVFKKCINHLLFRENFNSQNQTKFYEKSPDFYIFKKC